MRTLYWQMRRELWEHKSIVWAPLGITLAAGLGLLTSLVIALSKKPNSIGFIEYCNLISQLSNSTFASQQLPIATQIGNASLKLSLTASVFAALVYCINSGFIERRDRTILFWKSMPVTDVATMLAKFAIPVVVLPLVTVAIALAVLFAVFAGSLVASIWLPSLSRIWHTSDVSEAILSVSIDSLLCGLSLAPVYAWLLLVSVSARRMPWLLGFVGPAGIMVIERSAIGHSRLLDLCLGCFKRALFSSSENASLQTSMLAGVPRAVNSTGDLNNSGWTILHSPALKILTSSVTLIGLAVAAVLMAIAIYFRKRQDAF